MISLSAIQTAALTAAYHAQEIVKHGTVAYWTHAEGKDGFHHSAMLTAFDELAKHIAFIRGHVAAERDKAADHNVEDD